jgi:DNA polymerase-3 subunit delta'
VSWQRILGHDNLVEAFDRVIKRGRLAHAYLFVGPPGVGKRLFADELAKALLCEGRLNGRLEACDQCPSCRQAEAGTHPDIVVAERPEDSMEVPIDVIRDLCRSFGLRTARGRGKVAILDNADDLNDAAANCFLKTLEEPPPRSVLLLIGTSADRQLETIQSRCQVVRFTPLPEAVVAQLLRQQGVEDAKLIDKLARLSDGSPGQARALADPALWEFRRQLVNYLAEPKLQSVHLAQEWMRFAEEAGKESASQRQRAALVLKLLIEFLAGALCLSVGAQTKLAEPEDQRVLKSLAERMDPDRLVELLERCLQGDQQIDRRVQLVLVLEALVDALGQKWQTG